MNCSRILRTGLIMAPLLIASAAWAHDEAAKPETVDVLIAVILRWMHILPAIIMAGGSFFIFVMLIPAAKQVLDDETHKNLRAAVIRRWKIVVHTCIALLLLSGFANFLMITRFEHQGNSLYHMLFGIKFLLALGIFFLAICLTSSKNWAASFRDNSPFWMRILVMLAFWVVLIGGYMKVMP